MGTSLEIKDVSVSFGSGSGAGAVEHFSMDLQDNSRTVLIGETGSGKSVLLLSILKLLPQTAHVSGQVLFQGENLLEKSEKELERIRGNQIAYIPQGSGNGLNPLLKVGFQVGEPMMEHCNVSKKEAIAKSIWLLRKFHIGQEETRAKAYPHTFSGGMRQRAMVAMGISAGASILLADEPTKGLDYNRIDMVAQCFETLKNKTLLCVTHDITFAQRIAEHIVVMYAAQQLEEADRDEFFRNPLHPYSRAILDAMPERGLKSSVGFAPPHASYADSGCRFAARCPHRMECCNRVPPMFEKNHHKVRCWLYAD